MSTLRERLERVLPDGQWVYPGPLSRYWLATRWAECNRVYQDAVKGLQ